MAGEAASTARSSRIEKTHVAAFLGVIAFVDFIVLALAGDTVNKFIDGQDTKGNSATYLLVIFSLVAGMATIAAIFSGLLHFKHFNGGSLSGASSTSLIAWALTFIAFGLACKQIDVGYEKSKLKALEAFVMILTFFETIYVLILHAGLFDNKYGVEY